MPATQYGTPTATNGTVAQTRSTDSTPVPSVAPGADLRSLVKRFTRLLDQRRNWEPLWQEISEFLLPRKSNVTVRRTPGSRQTQRLFDSTPIHANELLASSMQGALTSAASQWFRLRSRDDALLEDPDVRYWLEDVSRRMYAAMQASNLSAEL